MDIKLSRREWMALAAASGAAFASRPALAQDYPGRSVRLVVAFPAGSSTDTLARIYGQELTQALGQSFIVDNRPGAGGNIATVLVSKERPDGHTLLVHSVAYSVNPSLYKNAGYDALKSLAPVAFGAVTPNVIFVNPSVAASSLRELIELAKKGPLSFASSGIGTTTHLGMELLFRTLAKAPLTHVPFGPAEAATNVVGNNVPVGCTSLPPALQFIRQGRLKPVAVTGAQRSVDLPDVPTVAEQGFPGFESTTWFGFFAPAGTPDAIVQKLNGALRGIVANDETRNKLKTAGLDPTPRTVPEFKAFLEAEVVKWAQVVRESGAEAN